MDLNVTMNLEVERTDRTFWVYMAELSYVFPTLVFMLSLFIRFGMMKKYGNPFYKLIQVDLLCNMLCHINSWFSVRFESCSTFIPILKTIESVVPGFLDVSTVLGYWFFHLQFQTAVTLCLHRLLSVSDPMKFMKLNAFLQKHSYWYIGYAFTVMAISSALTFIFAFPPGYQMFISEDTLFGVIHMENMVWSTKSVGWFSVFFFFILVGVRVYLSRIINKPNQNVSARHNQVWMKLTTISVRYCYVYIGILGWSILTLVNTAFHAIDIPWDISKLLLSISSDMMTLSLPYILLVYDSNVKKDLLGKFQKTNVILVTSIKTTAC